MEYGHNRMKANGIDQGEEEEEEQEEEENKKKRKEERRGGGGAECLINAMNFHTIMPSGCYLFFKFYFF
eukprot:gene24760-1604_t